MCEMTNFSLRIIIYVKQILTGTKRKPGICIHSFFYSKYKYITSVLTYRAIAEI